MAENTTIEWADATVNHWAGCSAVSPACDHCYAQRMAGRLWAVEWGAGKPRRRFLSARDMLEAIDRKAQRLGRRLRVFHNSLSDMFDNEVPDAWRMDAFKAMADTPHLIHLVLTKRIGNVRAYTQRDGLAFDLIGDGRVWLGITVVNQDEADRDIPKLLDVPAAKRFLSMEPLLSPIDLKSYLNGDMEQSNDGSGNCVYVSGCHEDVFHRRSGPNMEASQNVWEQGREQVCISTNKNRSGGKVGVSESPTSDVHAQRAEAGNLRSSSGLDVSQWARDTRWDGDQPQGRESEKQPSGQSRGGDSTAKHASCGESAWCAREEGAVRGEKFKRETQAGGSLGHSSDVGSKTDDAGGNGKTLRGFTSHDQLHLPAEDLGASSLDWVIVGSESGSGARRDPNMVSWVASLRDQCVNAGVAFLWKQDVIDGKKISAPQLEGQSWQQFPA